MSMIKCSPEAFELCKTKCYHCRGEDVAFFVEGSDCDRFNKEVAAPKTEPDLRERLIELLESERCLGCRCGRESIRYVADRLIAKGVTIATDNNVGRKWIPATERLPERYQNVLTVREDRQIRFDAIGSLDVWYEERWHTGNPVTHWMPLPEPPKGE